MSSDTTNTTDKSNIRLIELEPGKSFIANGKKYTVCDSFTIGRLEVVNQMEEELAMFATRPSCHDVMTQAINLLNDYKPVDAGALLRNKIESDRNNAKIMHYTIRVVTAYINADGEDVTTLTEEQIKTKIQDWSAEGLDVRPFFTFAMKLYSELLQNSKADMLNILLEAKSIREKLEAEI